MSEEPSRPGPDTLADYLEGLLSTDESREVERWVAEDAATAELLHELKELPGLLAADPGEPMPGDVVDRVDAALAEAARAVAARRRIEEPAGAVVMPLRPRRWLAPALAAAAVAAVVGIGAQVVSSQSGIESSSSAGGAGDGAQDAEAESAEEHAAAPEAPTREASSLPPIRTDSFATDVADALADEPADLWRGADESLATVEADDRYSILSDACAVELGAGRVLAIRLDDDPAVLVLRRIPGEPGRREALAYPARCPNRVVGANEVPLARAVVPLP